MAEQAETKRKVVIAMDGSEHSKYAFEWFVTNVHRPGDNVVVVHSVEFYDAFHSAQLYYAPGTFDEKTLAKMIEEESRDVRKELEQYATMMKEHHIQGSVKSIHCTKPGEGIIKEAEQCDASLIIVGSRGQGKLRRTFIGSVSDYIMNHAHIPVIVCKHKDFHHQSGFHLFGHHNKKNEKEVTEVTKAVEDVHI